MKRIVLLILIVMSSFLLFSCGSSDDGGGVIDDGGASTSTLSGVAAKGPVLGGTVEAFKIFGKQKGDSLGTTTTSLVDGSYSLDIGSYTGPVLIEVTGGKYIDEATKKEVDLYSTLRAAVPDADGKVNVSVTPLTEIAVQLSENTGFTREAITNSNAFVSQLLGENGDILATRAVDLTSKELSDDATPAELKYSLMLAAISQMTQMAQNGFIPQTIEEVIKSIAEDLKDSKMDETAVPFKEGLEKFAGSSNNASDQKDVSSLTDEIVAAESGLDPVGDLVEARTLLNALIADMDNEVSFSNSYDAFINFMDTFVAESPKAHLFKAVASLMNIYHSDVLDFITDDDTGLGLSFDTDFKYMTELEEEELRTKAIDLLKASNSFPKDTIKALFAELETELEYTDSEFELAQGAEGFSISLTGFNAVYIDGTDVKVMRGAISLLKAVCEYVQSLDLDVVEYDVTCATCPVSPTDIRDLNTLTEAQEDEFIAKNSNILKLDSENGSAKLAEFKDSILAALTLLGSAVTDLDALSENQRRNRRNSFTIDNEMLAVFKQFKADYPVDSNVLTDADASLYVYGEEETAPTWVVEGSYAYFQETIDIYRTELTPSTAMPPVGDEYITVYDFVSGHKSLREILEMNDQLEVGQKYRPYVETVTEKVQSGVKVTQWDDPVDAATVPLATIDMEGDGSEWESIPVFESPTNTSIVKIARDGQNNFYVYCESTSNNFEEFQFGFWGYEWDSYNGYSLGVWCNNNGAGVITSSAGSHDNSQIGPKNIGANAVVYKFESGYSKLSKEKFHQKIWVWYDNIENSAWQEREIRLLPLVTNE